MAIEIYFSGLLCFRGSDRVRKSAVMILDDTEHEPSISFSSGASETLDLSKPISLIDLPQGPATSDKAFHDNQHVPHLDDLTHPGIIISSVAPASSLILPDGILSVAQYYPLRATYKLGGGQPTPSTCVARVAVLTVVPTQSARPAIAFNDRNVPVLDGSWILIGNIAVTGPGQPGDHWLKNHRFTNGTVSQIARHRETNIACVMELTDNAGIHREAAIRKLDELIARPVERNAHDDKGHEHAHDHGKSVGMTFDIHSECSSSQYP